MTYGVFNLESGNALAWFDSPTAALEAVRRLGESEPDIIDDLGLMEFDDEGQPGGASQGRELFNQAQGALVA